MKPLNNNLAKKCIIDNRTLLCYLRNVTVFDEIKGKYYVCL